MKKRRLYSHIDEVGMKFMESISPGALLRVSWIEDPDVDGEWGLDMIYFDDVDKTEDDETNNIVMLVEWMPQIQNNKNIITFKCLHEYKMYYSSTYAILEIIK